MKTRSYTLIAFSLAACLIFSVAAISTVAFPQAAELGAKAQSDYSATNFTALPNDWELSALCDTPNVTTAFEGGNIVIKSTSTQNQSKYYGAMYLIDKGKSYGDFTFEMQFKMQNPADNNRWLGVMYHTQTADNGKLIGYLMNFRYSGGSAASVVTPSLNFADEAQISTGVGLADGAFHKLKIVMSGTTARHYIDGNLITEFDTTIKNSLLGGAPLTSGGFSLIVNRSTVSVKSVKISSVAAVSQTDMTLADTYTHESKIIGAPTVVSEVTRANYSALLGGDTRPSNAILHFDKNCNITDESGNVIATFENAYKSLDKKIIPIAYVDDAPAADALIEYINDRLYVLDMAVMSDKAELVERVRKELPHIRGIVEYKQLPQNLYAVVEQSTKAQAMTVVIPQDEATVETVAYLQARFKTVWVRENGETAGDILGCINSGCYGIVTTDSAAVYEIMDGCEGHVRNIFNVAHRGLPNLYNENSLSGIEAAMRAGVTHLELDGHLTKDKHIVITHDDNIERETSGSGLINDLTLEQILSYDLDLKTPHEKMPTLERVIDLITEVNAELNTSVVLVFEIKDDSPDFVDCMKRILDEKNFYENLVIITFEGTEHQLAALKEKVPQVPTSNLDSIPKTSFASALSSLNRYNTGIDNIQSNYNREYAAQMCDRGFLGWYWTYSAEKDVLAAEQEGILGVTTNSADCFGKHVRFIRGEGMRNATAADVPSVDDEIDLTAVLYDGMQISVTGKVTLSERTSDGWHVLAEYEEQSGSSHHVHRTSFIYYYAPVKNDKGNLLPIMLGIFIPLGALAIALAVVLIVKKRKVKA